MIRSTSNVAQSIESHPAIPALAPLAATRLNGLRRLFVCLTCLGCLWGCDVPIDSFEANRIFAKRLELNEGIELEPLRDELDGLLVELFGSPDLPQWPQWLNDDPGLTGLISLERLQRAAGAVRSDENDVHFGLYREHCILCHGIAGNGLGATSRLLNPYPRDFRVGKFKFKSTPLGSRPTRDDLARLLRDGIPGTSMPAFRLLPEDDLQALIDYVIYLSIRGEVERELLSRAAFELDVDAGESWWGDEASRAATMELVRSIAAKWTSAADGPSAEILPPLPPRPDGLPLVGEELSSDEWSGAAREKLASSISHGRELFQGQVANCASCHGPLGAGDGTVNDYDDWTKDWTTHAGLDPQVKSQIKPMLALGALKPHHIPPRNLQSGVYRGGGRPEDLVTRIVRGIEGTPMPAAPLQPENELGLKPDEVWDLVNFLLSLPTQPSPDSSHSRSSLRDEKPLADSRSPLRDEKSPNEVTQ